MPIYLDVLVLVNFLVDLLLLIGTNRLSGYPVGVKRAAVAAAVGAVYAGACVLPGLAFFAGTPWRLAVLWCMGGIAFGFRREAGRRCILFVLLSMALGGVAMGLQRGFWSLLICAGAVCAMCLLGFRGRLGQQYVPVIIRSGGADIQIMALRDTGNTLTDPLTGQQILVVSAGVGSRLTGLSRQELEQPAAALEKLSGLRLIPFHAVGRSGGVLAAKRYEDVTIGAWRGSCLIAFAPNELGQGKPYEALTGGV